MMSIMRFHVSLPPPIQFLWVWCVRPLLLFAGIPYLCVFIMFAGFQRSLIYGPAKAARIPTFTSGLNEQQVHSIAVQTPDDLTLNGWHITAMLQSYPDRAACDRHLAEGGLVVLFFPGNGGHRGNRMPFFKLLASLNADVFAFDYRGYGDNAGEPSEAAFAQDALTIWKYLTLARKIEPPRIVIYGESLGGGVAIRLAAQLCQAGTPPAGIILCATFPSLVDVGRFHYRWLPVSLFLIDRYPSTALVGDVTCPILQVHGAQDSIIPLELGKRLFDAAPPRSESGIEKRFVTFSNSDHNDIFDTALPEYRRALLEFLTQVKAGAE